MTITPRRLKIYDIRDIEQLPQLQRFSPEERFAMKVVASVLPFRTNNYVIEELIDWSQVPYDPMYRLTFMYKELLLPHHYEQMANVLSATSSPATIQECANMIRMQLNPHPAGQRSMNIPIMDEEPVDGIQHKYRETCLIFPSHGQTCHAYCSYCFRWPQFTMPVFKFATDEAKRFETYLKTHKEITDVLITGGDPMIMKASRLACYIEPLLTPDFEHIRTIRIGTKSLGYWPYRYVTDEDADDVLRLFERVIRSGKHLAIMGHYNHWKELVPVVARTAISRIRNTGAIIRTQSPLVRSINETADDWVKLWEDQVQLGCVPYYMFVVRDTGANHFFAVSLSHAFQVFSEAYRRVSGLSHTVRGPCMSASPGKIVIEGITTIRQEKVFVLSFLRGRNPHWCKHPFFARYDEKATWFDQLRPAFNEQRFFYEDF
jgi:KamA family protein